jgi:hypothetical protein
MTKAPAWTRCGPGSYLRRGAVDLLGFIAYLLGGPVSERLDDLDMLSAPA